MPSDHYAERSSLTLLAGTISSGWRPPLIAGLYSGTSFCKCAGIDPDNLLIDLDTENNIKDVKIEK